METNRIGFTVGIGTHYSCTAVFSDITRASVGDFVLVHDSEAASNVWAKITKLEMVNPLLPLEAIGTLATEGLSPAEVPISLSREQLTAELQILGVTQPGGSTLETCVFPVRPASSVFYPETEQLEALLYAERPGEGLIDIGVLRGRADVHAKIDANRIASRHLAVLAMTGAGKTVAVRSLVHGFFEKDYPVFILDPHGDYFGFKRNYPEKTRLFFPSLTVSPDNKDVIVNLIYKFTTGLSEAQQDVLETLLRITAMETTVDIPTYIDSLLGRLYGDDVEGRSASKFVINRKLRILSSMVLGMMKVNEKLRMRIRDFEFEPLPDTSRDARDIIAPGQLSILYLGGYDDMLQSTIVSLAMENLFGHRLAMDNEIPPFLTVLEEAHNFIPSSREGTADVPSLPTLRKVITEGRKFGAGLIIVSQRPSRLDTTLVSQCNSFLVLRMINPADQNFVKNVVEGFGSSEAIFLPALTPGEGIWSGQSVRFPIQVRINYDTKDSGLRYGEDFLAEAKEWSGRPRGPREKSQRESPGPESPRKPTGAAIKGFVRDTGKKGKQSDLGRFDKLKKKRKGR